jgi:hypothetical protein
VIAINVPHRHGLLSNSCVNNEVKVFNGKVEKLGKAYENLSVLPVDFDRDLFTKHGLHLNTKGKENIALKVALMIKNLFNRKKKPKKVSKNNDSDVKLTAPPEGTHVPLIPAPQEVIHVGSESTEGSQIGGNSDKGNSNKSRIH